MIKAILLLIITFVNYALSDSYFDNGSGKVTKIYAHYDDSERSYYTANNKTYFWGTGKNLTIDGFEYNGYQYKYISESPIVKIRRSDNIDTSGNPCGLFAEKDLDEYHLKATYPQNCDMAKVMSGRVINIGALDLFKNTGYTAKNIERVDFISPNGIVAPNNILDLKNAGHVVTEKSGNNQIKIAAILSLDQNGDPASFGSLVAIHGGGLKDYGITTIYLPDGSTINKQYLGFYANEMNPPQSDPWHIDDSHEALGMCFVSLKDLGIAPGQKYYGFAYFGRDVTDSMNLVDYNSFPKSTGGDTADPYGGVASYFVREDLVPKLIVDYRFDECDFENLTLKDSSGNDYNATIDNSAGSVTRSSSQKVINSSARFSKGVITADISGIDLTKDTKTTVSLWINWNGSVDSGDGYSWGVSPFSFGEKTNRYSLYIQSNNMFGFNTANGDVWGVDYSSYKDGWHHIVAVFYNGDVQKSKLYIDGILQNCVQFGNPNQTNAYVKDKISIGGKTDTTPGYYFEDYIDEVKIFQGELSSSKIDDIYNYEKDGKNYDGTTRDPVFCDDKGICYALSDVKQKLYKTYVEPGSDPLPTAVSIPITGLGNDTLNSEGMAYNTKDGLVYAFHESADGPKQYVIDPSSGQAKYIKTYTTITKSIVGASFYSGTFYIIGKNIDGDAELYIIDMDNWTVTNSIPLNGDTTDADALAINKDGDAYIVLDDRKKIYSIDLKTAHTTYITQVPTRSAAEAMAFAQDENLYIADSEDGVFYDTDKIYKVDLKTGDITEAAQIPPSDDVDIEGLSCNIEYPEPISLSISDINTTKEGDSGYTNVTFTINADQNISIDGGLSITYSTSDATAFEGSDYVRHNKSATINKGSSSISITIPVIIGDTTVEEDEYFYITIECDVPNVQITQKTAKIAILNDDVKFLIVEPNSTQSNTDITTKIVNKTFDLKIISVDEKKNPKKNTLFDDIAVRIVDYTANCLDPDTTGLTSWKDINLYNQTETTVSFILQKAYKNTKVQIKWDENDTKANCSIDNFAVRPNRFQLNLPTSAIKANEDFDFDIKALDNNNNPSQNYNEQYLSSFLLTKKDQKSPTCTTGTITFSKEVIFANGKFNDIHTRYDDIGKVDINISEIPGKEFAIIDSKDTSDIQRYIASDTKTVTFVPSLFLISASLKDFAPNITFYANSSEVSSMGSLLDINISAATNSGKILSNYTDGCYSKDTNLTLSYTNSNHHDSHTIVSDFNVLFQDCNTFILDLNKSNYTNGTASKVIKLNLSRDNQTVKNPSVFSITDIQANDTDISSSISLTSSNNAHYYYAREHVSSPQTSDQLTSNIQIYDEIYCKNCNKSIFIHANNRSSIDEVFWYILPPATVSFFGTGIFDYYDTLPYPPRSLQNSTVSKVSPSTIKVTAPELPYKDKIYYTPTKDFLRYSRFSSSLPEHYFNIDFTSSSTKWAGEGTKGKTVDLNISKNTNHSLEW